MTGEADPRIADYVRKHRERYTPEAIRQRLLEAGYPAAEVDAALVALVQEPRQRRSPWAVVLQVLLITVAVICVGALLIGAVCIALILGLSG
ncbi:MAG: hypothetical protein M3O77_04235 [Chloroflexota bacterium]|nr:hypothetical protein [Chloroflexota bacterium]